jgi:hypothetical protein
MKDEMMAKLEAEIKTNQERLEAKIQANTEKVEVLRENMWTVKKK